jgi:hypothetical protein
MKKYELNLYLKFEIGEKVDEKEQALGKNHAILFI